MAVNPGDIAFMGVNSSELDQFAILALQAIDAGDTFYVADLNSLAVNGSFESIVEVPNSLTNASPLPLLADQGTAVFYNDDWAGSDLTLFTFQKSHSEIVALGSSVVTLPAGAISLSTPYSQDFNTLISSGSATWADNSIDGWYTARTGSGATIVANNGSSTAGNLYSYGSTGSSDRALGSIGSGNAAAGSFFWGARFFNDTGSTVNTLYVNYLGEQWRSGGTTSGPQTVDFQYQIGATGLNSGTWINADSLDFASLVNNSAAGALNGNANTNRTVVSGTITGLSLNPGQEIWLRWSDPDHPGSDHGLAIDDVKVSTSSFPGITITESGSNTTVNEEGETTDTYTLALNTAPTAPVSITITAPDNQTRLSKDGIGFSSSVTVDLNSTTPQTITVRAVNDTSVESATHTGTITHTVTSPDLSYNGLTVPDVNVSILDNDIAINITKINQIQGSGATFNSTFGGTQTIEGVVVASFLGSSGLGGFYVQEEDTDWDNDAATAEGIFVYDPTGLFSGSVGSKVRVTGTVGEYTSSSSNIAGTGNSSLTQLSSLTNVVNLGTVALPTVTNVVLPVVDASVLERYEGMLVNVSSSGGPLVVTETFKLGRFGQVGLSGNDRLGQYTQFNAPSVSSYANYLTNLRDNYIILDDGSTAQNPDPVIHARGGQPLSATNTLRGGDTIASITGVLDERFEGYRVQATTPANFQPTNPREATAPAVGGTLRVASANLLNFFNGNGIDANNDGLIEGGFPTSRGADTAVEFKRQIDKTVQAVLGLNADVFGYNEMENDGYGPNSAVQELVDALNAATAPGTYAFVVPPASALNTSGGFGGDEITVGFIYKTSAVRIAPGTHVAALTTGIFAQDAANRAQRPSLAVTFERLANGTPTHETFSAVINHFKSKGSAANLPGDADQNDGQGFSNATRTQAAQELAAWLATNPTGTTDPDYLIMGDLNAYRMEDPITALINAGYNSLFGSESYSYQFNGQWGSLDHALASASISSQVTGAAKWHINSDEPIVLDYNTEFKTVNQVNSFYNVDPFRTSDHDPIVVGLNLKPSNRAPVSANDTATTNEETAVTFEVLGNDFDPDNDTLVITQVNGTAIAVGSPVTLASGALLTLNADRTFSYNPNGKFEALAAGQSESESFIYTVSDGKGGTATATVNVAINGLNDAPTASGETVSTSKNTGNPEVSVTVDLSNNLFDPDTNGLVDAQVSVQSTSNGAIASINQTDRLVTFTPTAGFSGRASFNYIVTDADGLSSNEATVFVEVGDILSTGNKAQDVSGNEGHDYIAGGNGKDTLRGLGGNDTLLGNNGSDILYGGLGNDSLYGGNGDDLLYGGPGSDTLTGGTGSDHFVLTAGEGTDTVTDFKTGTDFIGLTGGLTFGDLAFSGSNILTGSEVLATLTGVNTSTLTASNFVTV